jgi:hypothetical protein
VLLDGSTIAELGIEGTEPNITLAGALVSAISAPTERDVLIQNGLCHGVPNDMDWFVVAQHEVDHVLGTAALTVPEGE